MAFFVTAASPNTAEHTILPLDVNVDFLPFHVPPSQCDMDVKKDFLQFHVGNDSLYVALQVDSHSADSRIVRGVLPLFNEL